MDKIIKLTRYYISVCVSVSKAISTRNSVFNFFFYNFEMCSRLV